MNITNSNLSLYKNWTEFDLNIINNNITNSTGEASNREPAWQTWLDISQIIISVIGMKVF